MFVSRDADGRLNGLYETRQWEGQEWLADADPLVLAYPSTPESLLSDRKADLAKQVNKHAETLLRQLTAPYPDSEPLTWSYKLAEAEAYLANPLDSNAPNLAIEAASREIPLQALAETVVLKSQQYRARCAQISGARGRHADAIAQLQTLEELRAYDWMSGWG